MASRGKRAPYRKLQNLRKTILLCAATHELLLMNCTLQTHRLKQPGTRTACGPKHAVLGCWGGSSAPLTRVSTPFLRGPETLLR